MIKVYPDTIRCHSLSEIFTIYYSERGVRSIVGIVQKKISNVCNPLPIMVRVKIVKEQNAGKYL